MSIRQFIDRLWAFVIGFDVFISYRRAEAAAYAEELARRLNRQGLICFLDREEMAAGAELSHSLKSALGRSRAMVCVVTPGVAESDWIRQEVRHFLKKPQRLWPVSVGGALGGEDFDGEPFAKLRERTWLEESAEAVFSGQPSEAVVRQIRAGHERVRVRRVGLVLGLVFVTVVAGGGGGLASYLVEQAQKRDIAYGELRRGIGDLRKVLRVLSGKNDPLEALPEGYLQSAEAVARLEKLNLSSAEMRRPVGPLLGFRQSPTGPGLNLTQIVATETAMIIGDIDGIRKRGLPLADPAVVRLVDEIAEHPFAARLAKADFHRRRFSEIEDSDVQPYYLLAAEGRPALCQNRDYLDFVDKLDGLERLLPVQPRAK
jgi:hypothetical protein